MADEEWTADVVRRNLISVSTRMSWLGQDTKTKRGVADQEWTADVFRRNLIGWQRSLPEVDIYEGLTGMDKVAEAHGHARHQGRCPG